MMLLRNNFVLVENEFQYAKSVDGKTTEEIQEALEESIKGKGSLFDSLCICACFYSCNVSINCEFCPVVYPSAVV